MKPVLVPLALFAACAAPPESSSVDQAIFNFGDAALQNTWIKASHNTYVAANTPGASITYHFSSFIPRDFNHVGLTNHIEIDLRDTSGGSSLVGNWIITHNDGDPPTTKCGAAASFSSCLNELAAYQSYYPNHPLVTVVLDKKQGWQNFNNDIASRSPWRLDNLIAAALPDTAIFRPADWDAGAGLRAHVLAAGWPAHSALQGKFMFLLSSTAENFVGDEDDCAEGGVLSAYAENRDSSAKVFVIPNGYATLTSTPCEHVETQPYCFSSAATRWAAFYNFGWESSSSPGVGDCNSFRCLCTAQAHQLKFLTRAYDVDDSDEYDAAFDGVNGGSVVGFANLIAIDFPWQSGGNGGYGSIPNGFYQ